MTRQELLKARANDVVEKCLHEGVCLSDWECDQVRSAVLYALQELEREHALERYPIARHDRPAFMPWKEGEDAQ